MGLGEFDLIRKFFKSDAMAYGVNLGIGDDCALLNVPEGKHLAVSMDTLVADVHFFSNADPELIAERALRVNLSDLAAMGADPLWFTLGISMPDADTHWLQGFSAGLNRVASQYDIALVGGDTTKGPLSITIQVHGAVDLERAMTRSGASAGDLIYVTGSLGDGAAALAVLQKELQVGKSAFDYFMRQFYQPEPQIRAGAILSSLATAAIDVSDGLLADLNHICVASGLGAQIDLDAIPISEPLGKLAEPEKALKWALSGGDDYQLCFIIPKDADTQLQRLVKEKNLQVTRIGQIEAASGVRGLKSGHLIDLPVRAGFQHF